MNKKINGNCIEHYKLEIVIQGYAFYWDITKLNCIQKLFLKVLGIKIKKIRDGDNK